MGTPHHHEIQYILEAGGHRIRDPFYIDAIYPDGGFEVSKTAEKFVMQQDPRLHPAEPDGDMFDGWQF